MHYRITKTACYLGFVTQAIAINLFPLLYVTFQKQYAVTLSQIGLLATIIFVVQIVVDLLCARFGGNMSYRTGCVAAHVLATLGLVGMCFLPPLLSVPYVGVVISAVLLSIGGGLIEVLISPIVNAIPGDDKAGEMSLLHSFYCWGVTGVVLLSTVYFAVFDIAVSWRWLVLLWSLLPAVTAILFLMVPLPPKAVEEQGDVEGKTTVPLLLKGLFWLFLLLMLCGGATELGPSQWSSLFAEEALGVTKTLGDLLGPCAFALLQGMARVLFALRSRRSSPLRLLTLFGGISVVGFVLVIIPVPMVSLLGFCLCGFGVGPMWPALLSLCAERFPSGGTSMFAMMALAGDVGCSLAPALIGFVSQNAQGQGVLLNTALRYGMAACICFPVILLLGLIALNRKKS